jgi:hypothetical protein
LVEKGSIKPRQDRSSLAVGPGEAPIEEWELEKRKRVDHGVESVGEVLVEVGVVFLGWVADEVEVA